MIEKVWVFGDSFAVFDKFYVKLVTYHSIITESLQIPVESLGADGSSFEYCVHTFLETVEHIEPNHLLIFFITDRKRTWFVKDNPWQAYPHALRILDAKFFDEWWVEKPLHVEHITEKIFFNYVDQLTKNFEKAPIFIQNFLHSPYNFPKSLNVANGTIYEISKDEYTKRLDQHTDIRANHLSEINHKVLATKFIDYIQGREKTVDLTSGFASKFLN